MNRVIAIGAIVVVLVALVGYGVAQSVSWAESRFGTTWTAAAVLCLIGVGIYMLSQYMTQRGVKHTLDAVADFQASNAEIYRANASADRERARLAREEFAANARVITVDAQQTRRIAQQQAGLLVDLERQRWEQAQQQPSRQPSQVVAMNESANTGGGPLYWDEE